MAAARSSVASGRRDSLSTLFREARAAVSADATEREQPRAHGSERGSPHNWSDETRRANEDFLRVVYELRLRPFRQGFVPATWDVVAQRCPQVPGGLAANAKYCRLKKLYMTPGKLPEAMHQVFSTYLQESDPDDVMVIQSSSRRSTPSLLIDSLDPEMMMIACYEWLWMVHLGDTGDQEETLAEKVAARMRGRSPVVVGTKIEQLVEAFKDINHPHHKALDRHTNLKQLVGYYINLDEDKLKRLLQLFAEKHPDAVEGDKVSFDDVLLWGLKHIFSRSSGVRLSKALYSDLITYLQSDLPACAAVFRVESFMERAKVLFRLSKREDKEDFLTKTQIRTIQEIFDQRDQRKKRPERADGERKSEERDPLEQDDGVEDHEGDDRDAMGLAVAEDEPSRDLLAPAEEGRDDAAIACAILKEIGLRLYGQDEYPDWVDIAKSVTTEHNLPTAVSGEDCYEAWRLYLSKPSHPLFDRLST